MNTSAATTENSGLRAAVLKISDLPALPSMLANLTALIQDPRTSADQIGQMLSSDPTLVSKVLKLVNSAFYGFPGRVGTVTQAVSILGFSSIRNIVLTTSVMRMWPGSGLKKRFDLRPFGNIRSSPPHCPRRWPWKTIFPTWKNSLSPGCFTTSVAWC